MMLMIIYNYASSRLHATAGYFALHYCTLGVGRVPVVSLT